MIGQIAPLLRKDTSGASIKSVNTFRQIRERLGVTQAVLAAGIGVTQGNVSFYEKGQTVPPAVAQRLIKYAARLGHELTFNDVYGGLVQRAEAA